MKFFPVFMDVSSFTSLVIGGGDVAARKTRQLLKAGARIRVVAPELCQELEQLVANAEIVHVQGSFTAEALGNCGLVVAATDDEEVNVEVSRLCRERGIPVNVVDNPSLCSFITPSIVDRDPVIIAVSSGGASPVLARLLRARLETLIPSAYGRLAELMKGFRGRVKERFPDFQQRRRFWEQVLQGPVAELLFSGQEKAALRSLESSLDEPAGPHLYEGEVYLVGGGPGDPDLLTFRALRLMQQVEVVLYDRLVSEEIVDLCRKDADRIYVGKREDQHALDQSEINKLLVKYAREGKRVMRLKGGDPFIFGRGGEEIETLMEQGISFQVVPGITAASGCASYAGIPLTHRDHAQSCTFITGHMKDGKLDLNWEGLVKAGQTIAVYMGIKGVDVLCAELIKHGMAPDTPAAIIRQGTRPTQRTWVSELAKLPKLVATEDIKPPSMMIIGSVVSLQSKLNWFESRQPETRQ